MRVRRKSAIRTADFQLYLMLAPMLLLLLVFRYAPFVGIAAAFKDYNVFHGLWQSPWIGFRHFQELFHSPDFGMLMRNTLSISLLKLFWGFPAPILLALLIDEARNVFFKRFVQNIYYLPHFLSWTIIAGLCFDAFSLGGLVNQIRGVFGLQAVSYLMSPSHFRSILVVSEIWKGVGWGTIIYLATLTSIDPNLYEAARIDGAGRLQQILHITLPELVPTIAVLLILRLGGILDAGMEQNLLMSNSMVRQVAEIIDTYVYNVGLGAGRYDYTTAVGLFKSVVAMVLVFGSNVAVKRMGGEGLW
jgi:putative aldouronate transport system permease protein